MKITHTQDVLTNRFIDIELQSETFADEAFVSMLVKAFTQIENSNGQGTIQLILPDGTARIFNEHGGKNDQSST